VPISYSCAKLALGSELGAEDLNAPGEHQAVMLWAVANLSWLEC
jgi:hypothetical protein